MIHRRLRDEPAIMSTDLNGNKGKIGRGHHVTIVIAVFMLNPSWVIPVHGLSKDFLNTYLKCFGVLCIFALYLVF